MKIVGKRARKSLFNSVCLDTVEIHRGKQRLITNTNYVVIKLFRVLTLYNFISIIYLIKEYKFVCYRCLCIMKTYSELENMLSEHDLKTSCFLNFITKIITNYFFDHNCIPTDHPKTAN